MLVVVSIAGCSFQNVEATVAPNLTSVPILLHFLWHVEKAGFVPPLELVSHTVPRVDRPQGLRFAATSS